jgi:hypothetical protein
MFRQILLLLAMISVTSCAENGRAQPAVADTFCQIAQPIYMDPADKLAGATWLAIVNHDETGERLCGWKPPT